MLWFGGSRSSIVVLTTSLKVSDFEKKYEIRSILIVYSH